MPLVRIVANVLVRALCNFQFSFLAQKMVGTWGTSYERHPGSEKVFKFRAEFSVIVFKLEKIR